MKKFYKSKTLVVNVLAILLVVADRLSGMDVIPESKLAVIVGAVNVVLRVLTKEPLKW